MVTQDGNRANKGLVSRARSCSVSTAAAHIIHILQGPGYSLLNFSFCTSCTRVFAYTSERSNVEKR